MLKALSKFFVCLAVLSPIIVANGFYFPFITGKALFFRLAIETALFCYLAYLIFLGQRARQEEWRAIKNVIKHPVFIFASLFTGIFVLSSLLSPNPSFSFWSNFERAEGGFQMLHYLGFFALLAFLFKKKSDWLGIFKFNLMAATLASLYAIAQLANYYEWIHWDWIIFGGPRPGGTLGNPAYLGGYALLSLLSAIFLFASTKSRAAKIIIGAGISLLLVMIFISNTRGALLALGAGIFLLLSYFAVIAFQTKPLSRNFPLMGLTAFLVFIAVFLTTPQLALWKEIPGLKRLTTENIFSVGATSLNTRLWTWGSAVSAIIEKPILGWGVENFPIPFDKYYNAKHYGSDTWYDRAHNVFLDYATSGGFLLLVAYLAIFAAVLKIAWRTDELWAKITAIWLVMYLIQGVVLFDILPIYLQMFLLLAFFVNNTRIDTNTGTKKHETALRELHNGIKFTAACALAIVFSFSFYYTLYLPYKKNILIIYAVQNSRTDPVNSIKYFRTALEFYSPIGRQETVESAFSFMNDLLEATASKNQAVPLENARIISNFVSEIFEKNRNDFVSTRPRFLLGLLNLRLAFMTDGEEFFEKAQDYCSDGNKTAPTRIEFLSCLRTVAEFKGDKKEQERLEAQIRFLRPDLFQEISSR